MNLDNWTPIEHSHPPLDVSVLVIIEKTNLSGLTFFEQHTGHRLNDTTWIVGGYFSFDLGKVVAWKNLPVLPQFVLTKFQHSTGGYAAHQPKPIKKWKIRN